MGDLTLLDQSKPLPITFRYFFSDRRKVDMPISHDYKCIFIHINKCGGQTIEHLLGVKEEHRSARQWKRRVSRTVWESYFTFAVVRNPFDKMVSMYSHRKQNIAPEKRSWDWALFENPDFGFNDWLSLVYSRASKYPKSNIRSQLEMIASWRGRILVDEIVRFEEYSEKIPAVLQRLGVTEPLVDKNRSSHVHYSEYYDPESIELVRRYFKEDIRYFGYEFEG